MNGTASEIITRSTRTLVAVVAITVVGGLPSAKINGVGGAKIALKFEFLPHISVSSEYQARQTCNHHGPRLLFSHLGSSPTATSRG